MNYVLTEDERAGMVVCFGHCLKAWMNHGLNNTTKKLCTLAFVAGVRSMHEEITDEEANKYVDAFDDVIDGTEYLSVTASLAFVQEIVFH